MGHLSGSAACSDLNSNGELDNEEFAGVYELGVLGTAEGPGLPLEPPPLTAHSDNRSASPWPTISQV